MSSVWESGSGNGRSHNNKLIRHEQFNEARQVFERLLQVKLFLIEDATEALANKNIDDVNYSRSILSKAVGDLETQLDVMECATVDQTINIDDLKQWRVIQKQEIGNFKQLITRMKEQLQVFDDQEM